MYTPQKNTVDPQINEQVNALFTEDAVVVTDRGPIYGLEAIAKYNPDVFKQFHFGNHIRKCDQYGAHILGTYRNGWQ
jgi:hypothetical protein